MRNMLFRFIGNTLSVYIASLIIPGIWARNFWSAALVALVLGALNAILKPILELLSLPLIIFTLGLFTLVINGFMLWIASAFLSGFYVQGFLNAMVGALFISVFSMIFGWIFGVKK